MINLMWIGGIASDVAPSLRAAGIELVYFANLEAALASEIAEMHPPTVVATADASEVTQKLLAQLPGLQVVVATRQGIAPEIAAALRAGAVDLIGMGSDAPQTIVDCILKAARRASWNSDQQQFLKRLRDTNETYLKTMINLEKRNISMEEQLKKETDPIDGVYRVLIVDDEPAICQLFEIVLSDLGHEVCMAESAEAALEAFRKQSFGTVITDKNLPGKDGLELLAEVKQLNPDTKVIMITGYGSKESAIDALNRGASAFLEKPFTDIDAIGRRIDKLIEIHKRTTEKRHYLEVIKDRNREYLDQYRAIRADLDHWLSGPNVG